MSDNDSIDFKKLNETLERDYKTNKGTITLTIVPKTFAPKDEGSVGVADVILSMNGNSGTRPMDGVEEMLHGLFTSASLVSDHSNFQKASDEDKPNSEETRKLLEKEIQESFPKIRQTIHEYSLYMPTEADMDEPYEKIQNGQEYKVGELMKVIGPEGGNRHKKKQVSKRMKTHKKRSKKQHRKTKGKKNTNHKTKSKIVKNGKKK
uniref:Uncharacterized protein n=1 Tax=viral metagenome TaxID=1070528 RepID=A0A6C0AUL9_9ZZZZ|tara:strand:- start:19525 stop:20142 length:618 start_codon:yes stop_codon:yes gene_type:complete